ncbi:MAG: hemerythrin domain-containing protein [Actinomycetota bacterium]|jgi:regulator of cell morphogenesis and NO signaling
MALERPPRLGDLNRDDPARGPSWTEYSVSELIDHLVGTHHAYLVRELPRLLELGHKILASQREALPDLATVMDRLERLDEELGPHLATEEEVLFPWCRRPHDGEPVGDWVSARIRCMRRQHLDTGTLLDDLRRLTGDFAVPADASPDYRGFLVGLDGFEADTRLHIHKEEDALFRRYSNRRNGWPSCAKTKAAPRCPAPDRTGTRQRTAALS